MLTDFEGERGEVGEAASDRSLSLIDPLSAAALGGARPLDFADTGVTGRAGVVGVKEEVDSEVGGAGSTFSFGRGNLPYLRSAELGVRHVEHVQELGRHTSLCTDRGNLFDEGAHLLVVHHFRRRLEDDTAPTLDIRICLSRHFQNLRLQLFLGSKETVP